MFPTLFRIGPVEIHSYGTMLMLGFVAGILLARRSARRAGLPADLPLDLGVWLLIAGVIGSRLLFVAINWHLYLGRPVEMVRIWDDGGLSFHGGLLGGVVAAAIFARRRGLSFWALADMAAPGLALGYGIARFGCLLNGCCYGAPTALPWGIEFPIWPDSQVTTDPSHPTQIYSALGSFLILGVLLRAEGRLRGRGRLFLLYLLLYSALRAAVEVLRKGYTAGVLVAGLTEAQVASAAIILLALILFFRLPARAAAPATGDDAEP
jgi:phosphatidylglycerol:prolipoprotein diacylglycerol transferase